MSRYIDADKLLEAMGEAYDLHNPDTEHGRNIRRGILLIKRIIVEQAITEVSEVKHGEWFGDYDDVMCTACHARFNICDNDTYKFKFCPNCGAKMKLWSKKR